MIAPPEDVSLIGPGSHLGSPRDTDEIFRLIVEASPNAIILADPCGRILLVNAGVETLFGYKRAELIGRSVELLVPERFRSAHPGHRAQYADDAEARLMGRGRDLFALHKDGSEIPVEIGLNPIETPEGLLTVSAIVDITERKLAEKAAAQFVAIVESSDDAIVGKDLRGIVTAWNAGAERIFGYSASEMIGQSIARLIPPDRIQEETQILAQIHRGESVRHFETVRIRKDGGAIDVSVTVSAIKDPAGRIIGASKVARDITEAKKARETIQRLNAELEQRVIERTSQLEAAIRELEAFSYSVSHDLRAPLRAVDGFSQAVIEDFGSLLPEAGCHQLQTIRASAQRMGMLIDDLLSFSRLGREPLVIRPVDTDALVREVLDDLHCDWAQRRVDFRLASLTISHGDPALLKQVWVNLLSNALKYTGKCEVAVIEVGCDTSPDDCIYFIRDNGAGFDMQYAGKLFGVFQRLHRAEDYVGTGVGLALVHRIIQRHKGRIWADAAVGRGATFYFTLGKESES